MLFCTGRSPRVRGKNSNPNHFLMLYLRQICP